MPLPAALLLQPNATVKPAWAVFDPVWYLRCYGEALHGIAGTAEALLGHYLAAGRCAGHAPNPFFDERHYLTAHPDIAALVEAGRYASGFDHFCQLGHRFHSGHWLFDEALYGNLHADMALENLDANGIFGRYDHYLRYGQREHRLAHLIFDSRYYLKQAAAAGEDARGIEAMGPFSHYLHRLGRAEELPPSIYFDPAWYRRQDEQNPARASAIGHYLTAGAAAGRNPVPEFSEAFYRHANPDVAALLEARQVASGYAHFLQTGVFELRQPRPEIDLAFYRDFNPQVRDDLNSGAARDAFAHLRAIGIPAGLPSAPQKPDAALTEAAAKELFRARAQDGLAILARRRPDFSVSGPATLSVVMVMLDAFALTIQALTSLRDNFHGAMQLILVDNGSSDETAGIESWISGATIIRLNRNIGYPRACNLALAQAGGEMVLFLNNDIELGFGAVEAAMARLRSSAEIGAVGGKIIRSHGLLQEAGCIIWQDGSAQGYMRDAAPLAPEANFVREVDFCSGAFLLCRTAAVRKLGGFDPDFDPAYYEEADLCVRMAAAGYRVVYDPAVTVHHLEYGSTGSEAARALMRRGQAIFRRKHAAYLRTRPENAPRNLAAARSPRIGRPRILFIEDRIPLRRLGSGYVRANDIVHGLAGLGCAVSVFPVARAEQEAAPLFRDFPDTAELLHDRDLRQLGAFLRERPGYYDLVWISRTHNLDRVLPFCREAGIDPERVPFVLDTEALAALRMAARAWVTGGTPPELEESLRREIALAPLCRHCLAVNPAEAGLLRGLGLPAVSVLGTARCCEPTERDFSAREGILFVAAIHDADSPNLDALRWYAEEILPALRQEMPEPPVLNVAGYVAPGIDLGSFAAHPGIRLHGPVMSLKEHYDRNRVFIAPTRFAAGTPYKLYEAAGFGLPIVATGLLAVQLGWQDGAELLAAPVDDAAQFAAAIARLYGAPDLWAWLRGNALARLAAENTPEAFAARLAAILESAAIDQGASGDAVAIG